MSETYLAIKFENAPSNLTYLGQDNVYPLEGAAFGYGRSASNGVGDTVGHVEMETSYLSTHDNTATSPGISQESLVELNAKLHTFVTKKMEPDDITIMEITASDDPAKYKVLKEITHENAVIRAYSDNFVINSDSATLSTIPAGGESADFRTAIDYKNRQVNGKS